MNKWLAIAVAFVVLLGGSAAGYFLFLRGPSRQEYVAQADPICKRSNDGLGAPAAPADLTQLKEAATKLATTSNELGRELRKLELPRGDDSERANQIVKSITDAGVKARALADAAGKEDVAAAEKGIADSSAAFKSVDDGARGFGFVHCGRSGSATAQAIATAAPAIFKKNFTTRADALCKRRTDELDKIPEPANQQRAADFFEQARATGEKLIADLRALPIASPDKPALDEFLVEFKKSSDKYGELRDAARAGNPQRLEAIIEELVRMGDAAVDKAGAFGLTECRRTVEDY